VKNWCRCASGRAVSGLSPAGRRSRCHRGQSALERRRLRIGHIERRPPVSDSCDRRRLHARLHAPIADTSLSGLRVFREFNALVTVRGRPCALDNGTELTSMAVLRSRVFSTRRQATRGVHRGGRQGGRVGAIKPLSLGEANQAALIATASRAVSTTQASGIRDSFKSSVSSLSDPGQRGWCAARWVSGSIGPR
jgi:hypothetical protein